MVKINKKYLKQFFPLSEAEIQGLSFSQLKPNLDIFLRGFSLSS
jgi:hypothetical protein